MATLGFVISTPVNIVGPSEALCGANAAWSQRFLHPGNAGTNYAITQIGLFCRGSNAVNQHFKLGILTDDANISKPVALVTGTETAELAVNGTTVTPISSNYANKPQVAGNTYYWIGLLSKDANFFRDRVTTGGNTANIITGLTYPTWPTANAWANSGGVNNDIGIWAVYEELPANGAAVCNPMQTSVFGSKVLK